MGDSLAKCSSIVVTGNSTHFPTLLSFMYFPCVSYPAAIPAISVLAPTSVVRAINAVTPLTKYLNMPVVSRIISDRQWPGLRQFKMTLPSLGDASISFAISRVPNISMIFDTLYLLVTSSSQYSIGETAKEQCIPYLSFISATSFLFKQSNMLSAFCCGKLVR